MPELPDDQDMVELRALLAKNAEAVQKLRAMIEQLQVALVALNHKPAPPEVQFGTDPDSRPDPDAQSN